MNFEIEHIRAKGCLIQGSTENNKIKKLVILEWGPKNNTFFLAKIGKKEYLLSFFRKFWRKGVCLLPFFRKISKFVLPNFH